MVKDILDVKCCRTRIESVQYLHYTLDGDTKPLPVYGALRFVKYTASLRVKWVEFN